MFDVSIREENGKVLGEFVVDSYFFEPSKYNYAFYLYKNDLRVDISWYTNSMKAIFNLEDMNGVFYIKAFIRDIQHGDTRSYESERLLINT